MSLSLQHSHSLYSHLQIFKRPQLPHFSTDLDETGIKIHRLLRSFIYNLVVIRIAVPLRDANARREESYIPETVLVTRPRGYKTLSMLNSAEYEFYPSHNVNLPIIVTISSDSNMVDKNIFLECPIQA